MKSSALSNPTRATVTAEISMHGAVDAVEHFAEFYPAERMDEQWAFRLLDAHNKILARIYEHKAAQRKATEIEQYQTRHFPPMTGAPIVIRAGSECGPETCA